MDKAAVEVKSYKEFLDQHQDKLNHLTAEQEKFAQEMQKVELLKIEIEAAIAQAAAFNPQIEQLKKELALKNAQIMDVGGEYYKKLKEILDRLTKEVSEVERTLTRNKTTLGSNESTQRKIDLDILRT